MAQRVYFAGLQMGIADVTEGFCADGLAAVLFGVRHPDRRAWVECQELLAILSMEIFQQDSRGFRVEQIPHDLAALAVKGPGDISVFIAATSSCNFYILAAEPH